MSPGENRDLAQRGKNRAMRFPRPWGYLVVSPTSQFQSAHIAIRLHSQHRWHRFLNTHETIAMIGMALLLPTVLIPNAAGYITLFITQTLWAAFAWFFLIHGPHRRGVPTHPAGENLIHLLHTDSDHSFTRLALEAGTDPAVLDTPQGVDVDRLFAECRHLITELEAPTQPFDQRAASLWTRQRLTAEITPLQEIRAQLQQAADTKAAVQSLVDEPILEALEHQARSELSTVPLRTPSIDPSRQP